MYTKINKEENWWKFMANWIQEKQFNFVIRKTKETKGGCFHNN